MTNRYLIANWKMNVPPEGIGAYCDRVAAAPARPDAAIGVAPPFVYIPEVSRRVMAGAQNCGDQESGAFTGEVAAAMLADVGARFAIVGHSERRHVYHESDALVARRLGMAVKAGLKPLLCVGEQLSIRENGEVAPFLAEQLRAAANAPLDEAEEIVIAYEPVWAIGTGRNASGAICAETCDDIRSALRRFWPAKHHAAPILYGGSVTPENVHDLWQNGRIDGFLVGGASLSSEKFLAVWSAMG